MGRTDSTSSAAMKAPEIPCLQKDQKVKDWRKLYAAATAGLTKEEQIAFLPLYVGRDGRDNEEKTIVGICAEEKTELSEVLDEFEALVDGAPSRMDVFNDVFELRPKSTDFSGLTNFYFKLMKEGRAAGMTYDLIIMRFLKFVKNGRRFYEEKKAGIKTDLTAAQTLTLFKALQAKLIPSVAAPAVRVKTEQVDEEEAFQLEEGKPEKMPHWAISMNNNLKNIEAKLAGRTEDYDGEESEVFWGQQNHRGSGSVRGGKRTNSTFKCYSCDGYNHIAAYCRTVCSNCKRVGHGEAKCEEKGQQKSQHQGRKSM